MNYYAPNLPKEKHCFFDSHSDFGNNHPKNLVTLNQRRHTNIAVYADHPQIEEVYADGAVTKDPGLILSVRTADCAPILFADYDNGIIAVAHAGWKGALRGIIESTLNLMLEHGADIKKIKTAIGPHMTQKNFEAQQDMLDEYIAINKDFTKYFIPKEKGYWYNSTAFIVDKLKNYGITDTSVSDIDTYDSPDHNSYRRNCHQGNPHAISQYSTIRL